MPLYTEYLIIFVTVIIKSTMTNYQENVLKKEIVTTLIKDYLIDMQFVNGLNAWAGIPRLSPAFQ
jgi:hypothetical protein